MQRGMAEKTAAERTAQFEVIDAKEFQRLLNLREHAAFEFDALGGDDVVGRAALRPIAEQNCNAADDGGQRNPTDVRAIRAVLLSFEEINGDTRKNDDDQKRDKLAYVVDHRGVAVKDRLLCFRFFRGGVGGKVGVAEAAFQRNRLDGLAANRARF